MEGEQADTPIRRGIFLLKCSHNLFIVGFSLFGGGVFLCVFCLWVGLLLVVVF